VVVYDPDNLGGVFARTRTGEPIENFRHVLDALDTLPFDILAEQVAGSYEADEGETLPTQMKRGVYIGEFWHPDFAASTVSGFNNLTDERKIAAAQADISKVQFVVCDFVTIEEWEAGRSDVGFSDRIGRIAWMQGIYHPDDGGILGKNVQPPAPPIWFAGHEGYFNEQAATDVYALADEAVASGRYDGIILRKEDGPWIQGARDENVVKVKPFITRDLIVVDVEEGKGKYKGMLGNLIVEYKGNRMGLSGMSDAERREWWKNPATIIGQIVEVKAMSESVKGVLREPRFKGIRYDTEVDE
jgi:DNA ligase-1